MTNPEETPADGQTDSPLIGTGAVGPSLLVLEWHQLLQVVYGVILSASIGAAAATGIPQLLQGQAGSDADHRYIWTLVCASFVVVAFDAWYQFSLHGQALRLNRGGLTIAVLMAGMVLSSFLPFQFVCRVFTVGSKWTGPEPVNLCLGIALCLTFVIEASLVGLALIRNPDGTPARSSLTVKSAVGLNENMWQIRPAAFIQLVFRGAAVLALIFVLLLGLHSGRDHLSTTIVLTVAWASLRLVEGTFSVIRAIARRRRTASGS